MLIYSFFKKSLIVSLLLAFAYVVQAQNPEPTLSVQNAGDSQIRIVWSDDAAGYLLEESLTLGSFSDWQSLSQTALEGAGELVIRLEISGQARFFRLKFTEPPLVTLGDLSPVHGERGVSVTRETILHFSAPLSSDTTLDQDMFFAEFGGSKILSRAELSSDGLKATLFYLEPLPGSAQVVVTFDGDTVKDHTGAFVDADGDGNPGGKAVIAFETLSLSPLSGTGVTGHVFASELAPAADGGEPVDTPLAGVTITLDGLEETHRTVTDAEGSFTLSPVPPGRFFVHIDGRTVIDEVAGIRYPDQAYYPFVGKSWEAVAGVMDTPVGGTGTVYLPLVTEGTLQATSMTQDTIIEFPPDVVADNPALAGVSITVPANSLFSDDGTRGGMVGIAAVSPDRLPGPLPQGLELPLVITVQTDGPSNFDRPAPVCFPNLPDPITGQLSPPGSKGFLMSFNHDKGIWEAVGGMTVSADGKFSCTDPGVGILQPGWHGFLGDLIRLLRPPPPEPEEPERFDFDLDDCLEDAEDALYKCTNKGLYKHRQRMLACNSIRRNISEEEYKDCARGSFGEREIDYTYCVGLYQDELVECEERHLPGPPPPETFPDCVGKNVQECISTAEELLQMCMDEAEDIFFEELRICDAQKNNIDEEEYSEEDYQECLQAITQRRDFREARCQESYLIRISNCGDCDFNDSSSENLSAMVSAEVHAAQDEPNMTEASAVMHAAQDEPNSVQDLTNIFDQIDDLLRPVVFSSSPLTQELLAQVEALLELADEVAGGDAGEYLRNLIIEQEEGRLLEANMFGLELDDLNLGNAPAYPVLYVASIIRPNGEELVLRGETQPYGQYTLFVPADAELLDVVFYDPLTKGLAIISPYLSPNVPYDLPRFNLSPLAPDALDSDADGLPDLVEDVYGTDSRNADSDDDGIPDGAEVEQGTDPLSGLAVITGVIGTVRTPGAAIDIATGNNLAVLAEGESGVSIVDISDFSQPTILTHLDTAGTAQRVAFSDNLVAVADGNEGLAVIDIADTTAARIIQQVNLPGAQSIAVAAGIGYVGLSSGRVVVVDLSSGSIIDQLSMSDPVQDLTLEGDFLYALTRDRLHVISLLRGEFAVVGSTASPFVASQSTRLFVGGGVAYALHGKGYNTLDVSNPAEPVLITQGNTTQFGWRQIVANGSGLGLAAVGPNRSDDGTHDISLYDLTDPALTEVFVTTFPTPGNARAVSVFSGLAYVADDSEGMQIINYLPYDANGEPPSITLSSSFGSGEAENGQPARVTALVGDDVQVRNVEFYLDDVKAFTDSAFPFEFRFVAPALSDLKESFRLRARAVDTGGNFTWTDEQVVPLGPDSTPPRVKATTPTGGGRTLSSIHAFFNEPMNLATFTATSLKLSSAGSDGQLGTPDDVEHSGGEILYRPDQLSVSLSFASPLPDDVYQAVITTAVTDLTGNHLAADFVWRFRVAEAVFWISTINGEWNDPVNWSEGAVPGPNDDLILPVFDNVAITLPSGVTHLGNLTIYGSLVIQGGSTLEVSENLVLDGSLAIAGGTLRDTAVSGGGTLQVTEADGTLDAVTLNTDITLQEGAVVTVLNDLTLNGTATLFRSTLGANPGTHTGLDFLNGAQTLGGTGEVIFGGTGWQSVTAWWVRPTGTGELTIGPDITIKTGPSPGTVGNATRPLIIQGTISSETFGKDLLVTGSNVSNIGTVNASNGGTISLNNFVNTGALTVNESTLNFLGAWSNPGTIDVTDAVVNLGGNFTLATLGTLTRSGGSVNLTGTLDNTGTNLALDANTGDWLLHGGTLKGGTVSTSDGATLQVTESDGTLDGVTLNTDITLQEGAVVTVLNGLTLNGTATLFRSTLGANPGNHTGFDFLNGAQTLGGTGEVVFGGTGWQSVTAWWVQPTGTGALTIGPNITIKTGPSPGTVGSASRPLIIQGTISSETAGKTILITGSSITNTGTVKAINGGFLSLNNFDDVAGLSISGGGTLTLDGTWTNTGTVTLTGSTLELQGIWSNPGTIDVADSIVNLGGNFTLATLGTLTRSEGSINITGTLDNTGTNLALDANTGDWLLSGGTITGGTIETSDGATFQVTDSDGTLDGVTLNTDITLQEGAVVTVINDLTLNGTAALTRTINGANSQFHVGMDFLNGTQTLGGTGEVIFEGSTSWQNPVAAWVHPTGTGELTIGPNIIIKTGTSPGTVGSSSRPLTIEGTISAETAGKTMAVTGSSITNDGSVAITAGGLVSITGSFTQSSSGTLAFELGGTLASEFGKLTSSKAFTLDGTLDVSVTGGFTPTSGNEFEIMTFSSVNGDFSTKNGLDQGGLTLQLNYGATNLRLVAP